MTKETVVIPYNSIEPGSDIEISFTKKQVIVDPDPANWPKPWFGGANAPWAVPIDAGIKRHPDNDKLVREYDQMCNGTINLNTHKWAVTKHYYASGTPMATMAIKRPEWCNMDSGEQISWDPSWGHGDDGDSYVTVIHPETGRCFLIWQARYNPQTNVMNCGTANIVTATGESDRSNPEADIWKKENGYMPSRAAGIALPHMLVTREELEDGEINHCFAAALPNPSRGTRVAPAIKNIGGTGSPGTGRLGTGFRFAYDIAPNELTDWAKQFNGEQRKYALAIGKAAIDYGFIIVDNGGNAERRIGSVYFEHNVSADWDSINFPKNVALGMLSNLLRAYHDKVYFLEEPDLANRNDVAVYPGVKYPK